MSITSMIIGNFYLMDAIFPPDETDTPLFVDTNAMLALSVTTQLFKTVGRWNAEIIQRFRIMKHNQLAFRQALNVKRKFFGKTAGKYFLRLLAGKGFDHENIITSQDGIVKG